MAWILVICTAGWGSCGNYVTAEYPSEKKCYRALNELYKRHNATDYQYVICKPKENK